ncbi:MAG: glutamine synthetase family protein [Cucumibacter sp.]
MTKQGSLPGQLPEPLVKWLNGREIEEVECLVADLAGMARGKTMPAKKFFRGDRTYIPSSIFYQTITGDYADVDVPNAWAEADLLLVPDHSTARAIPWSSDVSIQVFHDLWKVNGEPADMAPRNVLKRVLGFFAEEGLRPVVAPEMEFYITKPNIDPDYPIQPPIGRTGREGVGRNSYSLIAVDEYGPVVDDIYDFAEAQGLEIDTMMQEGGAGQLEINLNHGDPVILADQVFLFKRTIREAALRHQCYATFMAKPMADEPGSAMHLHMSVTDQRTGKNIFNGPDDAPSEAFYWFLGGQQTYVAAAMCMLAPYVNSYRRLVPDQSAPTNLEWAADNRSVGLRIPVSDPNARRIENRVIGMDCNPYLAIAAALACGYLGLKQKIQPREAFKGLPYEAPHALPRSVLDALEQFEATPELRELLGVQFASIYGAIKRHEYNDFLKVVSPWEREHLMLNV